MYQCKRTASPKWFRMTGEYRCSYHVNKAATQIHGITKWDGGRKGNKGGILKRFILWLFRKIYKIK